MKTHEQNRLDELFGMAKSQVPEASFQEVKKRLIPVITTGLFALILLKLGSLFTKFKLIVMLSTLGLVTLTTVYVINAEKPIEKKPIPHQQHTTYSQQEPEIVEVKQQEDGNYVVTHITESKTTRDTSESFPAEPSETTFEVLPESEPEAPIESNSYMKRPDNFAHNEGPDSVDISDLKVFTIIEKTTELELQEVMDQAEAAGIDVKYKAHIRKSYVRKLDVKLKIETEDGPIHWNATISGTKSFTFQFGWKEDGSGKAVRFASNKEATGAQL